MSAIYSNNEQLQQIAEVLSRYVRLPFTSDYIPGAIMEGVLAYVRGAQRLNTYDFVDVIDRSQGLGWQVKSTKAATPVTWKRAKIPNADRLISDSNRSAAGLQALGNAIIGFCNQHAQESLKLHDLKEIGYSRLVIHDDGTVMYFERLLCTRDRSMLFDPEDFTWRWSVAKQVKKKEQLPALHGIHKSSHKKCWAWHGLGENQLHFSGEGAWWPKDRNSSHSVTFRLPTDAQKLTIEKFLALLEKVD